MKPNSTAISLFDYEQMVISSIKMILLITFMLENKSYCIMLKKSHNLVSVSTNLGNASIAIC